MRQLAYYLVVIVLGLGNLVLAAIAYRQRDKQIKGFRPQAAGDRGSDERRAGRTR